MKPLLSFVCAAALAVAPVSCTKQERPEAPQNGKVWRKRGASAAELVAGKFIYNLNVAVTDGNAGFFGGIAAGGLGPDGSGRECSRAWNWKTSRASLKPNCAGCCFDYVSSG